MKIAKISRTIVASFVVLLFLIPLFGAIYTSIRTDNAISSGPFNWAFDHSLTHYKNALGAAGYNFSNFFKNSVFISTGTVALTLLLIVPAGYGIVRLGFARRFLLQLSLALRITPAIFFIVPFFELFANLKLIDSIPGMIFADTFVNFTLALLVLSGSIRDLPSEVEEAAEIDGASTLKILRLIVFPLLKPAIAAVGVLTFLFTWSDYLFGVVLTSTSATPVTVGAAYFVTSYGVRWGDISAAIVLSVIPPLFFATLAQKYLVKGLSAGAIKG
jgi:multiple sugar transport system permease protein